MIEHCFSTEAGIDGKMNSIADLNAPFSHSASMDRELRSRALGIDDFHEIAAGSFDGSPIANLSPRLAIKGRLGGNYIDFFAFDGLRLSVAVAVDGQNYRFSF